MMEILTHRERVLRSAGHLDLDRIPFFYRAEPHVSDKVKERLGLRADADLIEYFDSDSMIAELARNPRYDGIESDCDGISTDMFGNRIRYVQYGEQTSSKVEKPVLSGSCSIDDIYSKVNWPGKDFVNIPESVRLAQKARDSGLAVYGGMWASLFTVSRMMMGEEHFLVSTIENPDFVEKLVDRLAEFYIQCNDAYFEACHKYVDVFYFGSDFGTQASMFISPSAFNKFFSKPMKRLCDHAKGFGLKIMFHTCGAVSPIIPDLIGCGVDILDPVQASAANMGPDSLGTRFKGRIAFHGGISTQKILPFGSPEEVRDETIRTISALGPTGLIAAPDQDMIGDIPVENIVMMYKTIREYRI
jgi:uroporphyrinogen decarboxylase